jgi:hypothetical protein
MVNLEAMKRRLKYFNEHREEIRTAGHVYAVVHENRVEYFDDESALRKKHPYFAPYSPTKIGDIPMFVDVRAIRRTTGGNRLVKSNDPFASFRLGKFRLGKPTRLAELLKNSKLQGI